jgi:hypothetical protein
MLTDRLELRDIPVQEAAAEMQILDDAAKQWTQRLNHSYQGTEHLLLGIVTLQNCRAARAITMQGLSLQEICEEILAVLGHSDISWHD